MVQEYSSPDEVPDEVIKDLFKNADSVRYPARNFNYIASGFIAIGDLSLWLPLKRVLPLIGVTPTMLRPVFNPQSTMVKRRFPFSRSWFGLNKNRYKTIEVELPEIIESYEDLGKFPFGKKPFGELAKILGKMVGVYRVDEDACNFVNCFIAYPDGTVKGAALF